MILYHVLLGNTFPILSAWTVTAVVKIEHFKNAVLSSISFIKTVFLLKVTIFFVHYYFYTLYRFDVVGYGCMTCIGNSGPLPESVVEAITQVCSFSCAAHLCKLFSAVCCSDLCVDSSALYKVNSVYILFCGKCFGIVHETVL